MQSSDLDSRVIGTFSHVFTPFPCLIHILVAMCSTSRWLNHDGPDASLRFTTVRQTPRGGSSLLVRCRRHHAHSLFFCDSMKVSRAEAGESLAPVRGRFHKYLIRSTCACSNCLRMSMCVSLSHWLVHRCHPRTCLV